jgi:glutathione synthase/RimK-type ligase-like ATP-grasp enzyme
MKVLILSSIDDPHAKAVGDLLNTMGVHVDFLKLTDFLETCSVSFELGTSNQVCLLERMQGDLNLNEYFSIWYRRPGLVKAPKFVQPWIGRMVESEARSALDGIFRSLSCVWMNLPSNNAACNDKLWQLQVASQIGLKIPETIVTNKPSVVANFFDKCDGQVIYKLIGEQTNQAIPANENPRGVSTLTLRKQDLPYLDQVVHAPHLFQRCIQKAYDLRVTVVGHEIFCTRIHSQEGLGKTDWRHDYTVPMDPFTLPPDIAAMCLMILRRLGLNYGAIDLVLTPDDQYVFLEINCGGQYLWVEKKTQQPISQAVANLLIGKSEPLVKTITSENV